MPYLKFLVKINMGGSNKESQFTILYINHGLIYRLMKVYKIFMVVYRVILNLD